MLEKSGRCRVTAIARSAYPSINKHGLTIRSKKFGEIPNWKPHRLLQNAEEAADRHYRLIICTVKCLPDLQVCIPIGFFPHYQAPPAVLRPGDPEWFQPFNVFFRISLTSAHLYYSCTVLGAPAFAHCHRKYYIFAHDGSFGSVGLHIFHHILQSCSSVFGSEETESGSNSLWRKPSLRFT